MAEAIQYTTTFNTLEVVPWVSNANGESAIASRRRPKRPLLIAVTASTTSAAITNNR
jgi:hypothetical protein